MMRGGDCEALGPGLKGQCWNKPMVLSSGYSVALSHVSLDWRNVLGASLLHLILSGLLACMG